MTGGLHTPARHRMRAQRPPHPAVTWVVAAGTTMARARVAQVTASLQTRNRRPGRVRRTEGSARCRCLVLAAKRDAWRGRVRAAAKSEHNRARSYRAAAAHTMSKDTCSTQCNTAHHSDSRYLYISCTLRRPLCRLAGRQLARHAPPRHTWTLVRPSPTRKRKGRS